MRRWHCLARDDDDAPHAPHAPRNLAIWCALALAAAVGLGLAALAAAALFD